MVFLFPAVESFGLPRTNAGCSKPVLREMNWCNCGRCSTEIFPIYKRQCNDVNLNNSEIRYLISVAQNIRLLWNLANKTMWGFPMKFGQKRDWTGDATLSGGGFRLNIILYLHSLFISITLISILKLKLKIEYWSWNCKSSAYAGHIPSRNAKHFVKFFFLSGNF